MVGTFHSVCARLLREFASQAQLSPNFTIYDRDDQIKIVKQAIEGGLFTRFIGTDGLRVDIKGNLYETGPGGVWIISPEGKHLGTIHVPEISANLAFGDPDRKTLYIAARTSIYKIKVNTPGI
mgnify:CR=1 FL=1